MVVAILFYVGLGVFIVYAIWGPKDQKPGTPIAPTTPRDSHHSSVAPAKDGTPVLVAGGVVGLLVVLGLAWLGGNYGSGNSLFPKPGGAGSSQPSSSYRSPSQPVWVEGYYRRDGTYVPGYYRSREDGNPSNNWSNYPNVNPLTGKPGTNRPNGGQR